MDFDGPLGRFYSGVQKLTGGEIIEVLPRIQAPQLERFCQAWLSGEIGPIDPTNMLVAGDQADQFLELPGLAAIIYEAALEQLFRHPDLAAKDTDCAAGSLNLLGILENAGWPDRIRAVALRAAKMPIKADVQRVRLAYFLNQVGEFALANSHFIEGMKRNPNQIAEETGVPLDELYNLGRRIAVSAQLRHHKPKLPEQIREATRLTTELFVGGFSCSPLWDSAAFFAAHPEMYRSEPGTSAQFHAASPNWNRAMEAHETGNNDEAIHELRTATRLFPGFVEAHGLLATCWLESECPAEALCVIDNALAALDGDYPVYRAMRARALSALGRADEAAVEWIKELYVVGPTSELLRSILQACLNLLPKTYDLAEYRRRYAALEVSLACAGRMVQEEGDAKIVRLLAKLYSRYELVGPVAPDHVAHITGMDWEAVRGIYRSYAD